MLRNFNYICPSMHTFSIANTVSEGHLAGIMEAYAEYIFTDRINPFPDLVNSNLPQSVPSPRRFIEPVSIPVAFHPARNRFETNKIHYI